MIKYPVRTINGNSLIEDYNGNPIVFCLTKEIAESVANALNAMNEYPVPFKTDNRLDKLAAWDFKFILKPRLKE
jgi:hypothetical protein